MTGVISILNCARTIQDMFVEGNVKEIIFYDYEPRDVGSVGNIAVSFGFPPDQNDRVYEGLEDVKLRGIVTHERKQVQQETTGSHGQPNPKKYKNTVRPR